MSVKVAREAHTPEDMVRFHDPLYFLKDAMPRIRSVKPEFFFDEDLTTLSMAHRLAFIGLWCQADKAGRLEDSPKKLKAVIFPYEKVDMDKVLNGLVVKPFIHRYVVNNSKYIQIINFLKHQRPHHTEQISSIPPSPESPPRNNGSLPVVEQAGREGKGEGKGEGKEARSVFQPPTVEEVKVYCTESNIAIDSDKFHNHYTANGWRVGRNPMKDWKAAVRNWGRNEFSKGPDRDDDVPEKWRTKK